MGKACLWYNNVMRLVLFCFAFIILAAPQAQAQNYGVNKPQRINTNLAPLIIPHRQHWGEQRSQYINMDLDDPVPPNIPAVVFKDPVPPKILEDRIDALFYGVNSYIAPEFDVFGYAVRGYMDDVLTPSRMNSPQEALDEYKNIRRARIVFDHWQKDLTAQIKSLEAEIEERGAPPRMIGKLTYNKGIIEAFMADMDAWLAANQAMAEFYISKSGQFEIVYPVYYFLNNADQQEFASLYEARILALTQMQTHSLFAKMIY